MEDAVCYPQVHTELMHHKLPDSFYSVDEWSGENMYVLSYMYMKICTDSVVWEEGHVRVDVMFPVDNGYSGNYSGLLCRDIYGYYYNVPDNTEQQKNEEVED